MSSFNDVLYRSGNSSLDIARTFGLIKSDDQNPDIHDYLKSDMGENRYRRLKNSESLRLQNIYIRRTVLQGSEEKKGIVNHESVVVELIAQEDGSCHEVFHIRAEKMMDNTRRRENGEQIPSGIVIQWMKGFQFNTNQDVKYECYGSGIGLKQMMKVLKAPPPRYDLVEANCWHYAAMATRDLIKKILENMKEENVRLMLQNVLQKAEQNYQETMRVIQTTVGKVALASFSTAAVVTAGAVILSRTGKKKDTPADTASTSAK